VNQLNAFEQFSNTDFLPNLNKIGLNNVVKIEHMANNESVVIIIQGMADLPLWANQLIANLLGGQLFDPRWHDKRRSLAQNIKELKEMVKTVKQNASEVILVGISAGAGLALVYLSQNKDDIAHIYTVGGVLNPDPSQKGEKFADLMATSPAFAQMTRYLHGWFEEEGVVERYNLANKVTAYASGKKGGDGILPDTVLKPSWAKVVEVGEGDHLESIGQILLGAIRERVATNR
jgi:pimeloyl-ACP methyl ester carboxylesterase